MASVLVVDDIDLVRLTLRKFLERGGHKVSASASAEDAEEAMRRSRPDIVVTDVWMPGMDGLTLIGSLREKYADTPIIAITGGAPKLPQTTSAEQALKAGAQRVLMKPVGMQALLSCVDDVLQRKHAKS